MLFIMYPYLIFFVSCCLVLIKSFQSLSVVLIFGVQTIGDILDIGDIGVIRDPRGRRNIRCSRLKWLGKSIIFYIPAVYHLSHTHVHRFHLCPLFPDHRIIRFGAAACALSNAQPGMLCSNTLLPCSEDIPLA
jgi:hypothetical protein